MKYKPLLVCAFCIACLWLLRCIAAGTTHYYAFIFINIFLASVPLLVEPLFPLIRQRLKGILQKVGYIAAGSIWLLFIPNAFYIVTDFMHLNSSVLVNMPGDTARHAAHYVRGDAVYMLDSLLILGATLFGAYAGGLALFHAYTFLKRVLDKRRAIALVSLVMLLSSIGIFIGRFGRWNSWDALYQPWMILDDLYSQLMVASLLERFVIVIITALIFHALSFYVIYTLARHKHITA